VPGQMLGHIIVIKVSDLLAARPADPSWPSVYIAAEACKSKEAAVNQDASLSAGEKEEKAATAGPRMRINKSPSRTS